MTAYTDLVTSAAAFDTSAADFVVKAKDLFDKAAIYESSIRTDKQLEGRSDTADTATTLRAALTAAIATDGTANAFKLAKALRLPIRSTGKTAAVAFP